MPETTVSASQVHRTTVGEFAVTVVSDGVVEFPTHAVGAAVALPSELDAVLRDIGADGDGPVTFGMNVVVVDTDRHRVLLDTGAGSWLESTGRLPAALAAAGIDAESVDVVVISHVHPDHVGGVLDGDGNPAFPKARLVLPRADAEFWATQPALGELPVDDGWRANLRSVGDLLPRLLEGAELIEADAEIVPGVTAVPAPGHTPGHIAVEVRSNGASLLYLADVLTVPTIQVPRTDWVGPLDNWPLQSVVTRRRLLDRAAGDGALVLATHAPFPGLARIVKDGDERWTWVAAA